MILHALYQLAQREGLMNDPDYEPKPVAWLVYVTQDGGLLDIRGTHETPPQQGKRKPRPEPKKFPVPRQHGRSGTKALPHFFVDNALYVFGLSTADKTIDPANGLEKSGWFRETVAQCAQTTGDEGAQAVLTFLEQHAANPMTVRLPEEAKSNDLFAFVHAPDLDKLVTDRDRVRAYWKRLRLGNEERAGIAHRCLVTGVNFIEEVGNVPLLKHLPGGTSSGAALVSFNATAFESYGWSRNENAPLSRDAAETCLTALNRLLHPAYPDPEQPGQTLPQRHLRLSADTVVCYWSAEAQDHAFVSVFAPLLEANPEEVKGLYRSIWRGQSPEVSDPAAFYALTLTGVQGRAVVRDWFESTVAKVSHNLAAHFADLDIVRNTRPPDGQELPPNFPLRLLLEALANPGKDRRKRQENIPGPLATQFTEAAFAGTVYPLAILQRVLLRFRAEIGQEQDKQQGWAVRQWNDARAALIKAVLNRRKRLFPQTARYKEVSHTMDPHHTSEGYILGQLMAVIERIQQEAIQDVNASVVDRYFSGASAAPKSVFVRLLKNARHHARKAKDDSAGRGLIFRLEPLLDELADHFEPGQQGFPVYLGLEQQGLFVLGYHQMRKWLWMNKAERQDWEQAHPTAPRAYLWNVTSMNNS